MFARVRWLKDLFYLMLDIAKLRSMMVRASNHDIRMQTIGSLIRQIWQQNFPPIWSLSCWTWFASVWAPVSAKTALCNSKRLTCFAHCTPTYPALQFRTGCNSDHATWFLTLVLKPFSRSACESGPSVWAERHHIIGPRVIQLCSMDFCLFASADRPKASNRLPLDFNIQRKGLNVISISPTNKLLETLIPKFPH